MKAIPTTCSCKIPPNWETPYNLQVWNTLQLVVMKISQSIQISLRKGIWLGWDLNSRSWKKQIFNMPKPTELLIQTLLDTFFQIFVLQKVKERDRRGERSVLRWLQYNHFERPPPPLSSTDSKVHSFSHSICIIKKNILFQDLNRQLLLSNPLC
jgi:hypothetical protein